MDNLDDSENNAKISDSAYSNSCSNSQSRRSHSSKSTHSGSNSSGSSGYGGKQPTSGSSASLNQLPEKRTKDKDGKKKKKQVPTKLVQIQADVEFRPPEPAPATEAIEESPNVTPPSPANSQTQKGAQRSMETINENTDEDPVRCSTPQQTMLIVPSKSSCSLSQYTGPTHQEGFSCVISMDDGVVLYMSSLTATLGFPKDTWIGRSFIDFVHPLDHKTFASQISNGLAVPKKVNGMQDSVQSPSDSVSTMFCRIRRYRGLDTGFNVKDRIVSFMHFMLRLSFKNNSEEKGLVIYLIIQATPLISAFKIPNEIVVNATPFVLRHAANGNLEYIDNEAVPFLGYLPQDITGQDVLKLYHPEDLAYMTNVYENIVKQGRATRSQPYRLMAQNGHYIKLETEWSSFINPWSRKLEFVIGKHHVIEGPVNPDVFQAPTPKSKASEEDTHTKGFQESIVRILNEVPTRPAELAKLQMTKRCQDLASFMESLIEDQPKVEEELRIEIQENDNSYYDRDSVMLGGISPHHDYNDGKSSSSTPLSYNQLNYSINLKRYFDSHEESFDAHILKNADRNIAQMNGQHGSSRDCISPMGQDSADVTSAESACLMSAEEGPSESPSCCSRAAHEYHPIRLTESLLNKHNSEMEKIFVKKHRESRTSNKEEREKINNESKQKKKDHLIRCNSSFVPTAVNSSTADSQQPHGLKRATTQFETEMAAPKQHCTSPRQMRRRQLSSPAQPSDTVATVSASASNWQPSFVNGMAPFISQQMSLVSPMTAVPGFVPIYYVPTTSVPCTSEMSTPGNGKPTAQPFQAPAVQYMMCGQAVFGSPFMVSPFPVQQNVMQKQFTNIQNNLRLTTQNYEEACKPGLSLKPQLAAWRAEKRAASTTVAATPPPAKMRQARSGSSSISSATNALNRSTEAIPELTGSRDSNMKSEENMDRTDGESSYSSFYSSFFKTESGSAEDSGDAKNKHNKSDTSGSHIAGKNNIRNRQMQRRKMEPPWMEHVCVTSELMYKYQVMTKSLDEVLISDKKKMDGMEQPILVNEQLGQLYMDMQLEGVAARLTLEEGITSSGSSGEETNKRLALDSLAKRAKRKRKYGKLVMIYEEDAPLPPPDEEPEPEPSISEV